MKVKTVPYRQAFSRWHVPLLPALLVCACCTSGDDKQRATDAQVVAPIDAAVITPDAHSECYLKPSGPEPSEKTVTVAWDVLIRPDDPDDGLFSLRGLIAGPAASYAVTSGGLIRVANTGADVQSFAYPGQGRVPYAAAASPEGLGVIFTETGLPANFCFTAWDTEFDSDDCVVIGMVKALSAVQWTGQHFSLAALIDGVLEVHTFTDVGVAIGSKKLAEFSGPELRHIQYYAEDSNGYRIGVTGNLDESACPRGDWMLVYSNDGTFTQTPINLGYEVTGTYRTGFGPESSIMSGWIDCRPDTGLVCTPVAGESRTVVTFASGSQAFATKVLNLPAYSEPSVVWDGDAFRLLALGQGLTLYSLSANGDLSESAYVPGAYDEPEAELAGGTLLALGPNDFLIVYSLSATSGRLHRAARVSIDN